jgi:aryl-alcohol dehydrogenase-like predicted oxidoreductase
MLGASRPAWLAAKAEGLQRQNNLAPFITGQMYYSLVGRERGYDVVKVAREIALARDVPVSAVALAWLADAPTVSSVIVGFADAGQLTQNLAAAQLVLTPDERARLDQVSSIAPPYPHSFLANFKHDPAITAVS